ncbi:2-OXOGLUTARATE (2OG) AND FE(II)-DEPENDENT OXYGENASE SUPERFAMILY PROTEIN-RELATED [Salix viminalis]|uniref:2-OXOGLUTARATE (2OG) AND FE(II)-DEPENDENT OXYGENASE SUPERFAMILY PROTEIN-RELATED n=1 Tax=Salix viminalis TaxID=40686 RepID=A0A9Q0UTR5_SALVM|nr:2-OXOGLUTARATE (2OG) AND FE(II)-DEPENDENT OXYGENASE SUPERFAMILY PROTEIN-RELATED [Salix viminalis]
MAQTSPVLTQETCEHTKITSVTFSNIIPMDSVLAVDEEIPTIDFFMLFSDDPIQQSKALDHLSHACDEYGFFYLVNHGVPDTVIEGALEGIAESRLTGRGRTAKKKKREMVRRREARPENGEKRVERGCSRPPRDFKI